MSVDPQSTVFIAYRRSVSSFLSLQLFQALDARGLDVFHDLDDDEPGDLETVLLNQIAARRHFVLLLAPGTLHGCERPDDWLRRRIEHAAAHGRHIIPVLIDGFAVLDARDYLGSPPLKALADLPAASLYGELDDMLVIHLIRKFIQPPLDVPLRPVPEAERETVERLLAETRALPAPTADQIKAERYFHRGIAKHDADDFAGAIQDYDAAIYLNPALAAAYSNRGAAHFNMRNPAAALADFNEAIRLDPAHAPAFTNRGALWAMSGDMSRALDDLNEALRLDPDNAPAYNSRGAVRRAIGDVDGALADADAAIRADPENAAAFQGRALTRAEKGDIDGALADLSEAIRLEPEYAMAFANRAEIHFARGDTEAALRDFRQANYLEPYQPIILAGLALAQHRGGNTDEARRLWRDLMARDARFGDAGWVATYLGWAAPLRDEAWKLIAGL